MTPLRTRVDHENEEILQNEASMYVWVLAEGWIVSMRWMVPWFGKSWFNMAMMRDFIWRFTEWLAWYE